MHSVHKIQLTPGHNFIALAQEKPSKPLRPGESPKTHLLHYKLDSKEVQQSSSSNAGGVGGATTSGDHSSCSNNHTTNVRHIYTKIASLVHYNNCSSVYTGSIHHVYFSHWKPKPHMTETNALCKVERGYCMLVYTY